MLQKKEFETILKFLIYAYIHSFFQVLFIHILYLLHRHSQVLPHTKAISHVWLLHPSPSFELKNLIKQFCCLTMHHSLELIINSACKLFLIEKEETEKGIGKVLHT